jgi:hypothetical protein
MVTRTQLNVTLFVKSLSHFSLLLIWIISASGWLFKKKVIFNLPVYVVKPPSPPGP